MVWDVLGDQWERNFEEAAVYYREHGNLLVPGKYVTPSGIKLGCWIAHLRMARKGKGSSRITDVQIARLNSIGMAWDADEARWRTGYDAAKKYYRTHGNLNMPFTYKTADGYALGMWLEQKRRQEKRGTLEQNKIAELDKMHMRWSGDRSIEKAKAV